MPRVTRSGSRGRATVREVLEADGQRQVTDFFQTTRRGRKPKKNIEKLDGAEATTISATQVTKELPSPPKVRKEEAQINSPKPASRKLFDDSPQALILKSPNESRKSEEQVESSPIKPVARRLFGDSPKSTELSHSNGESVTKEEIAFPLLSVKSPSRTKAPIKNVGQLQNILAQKRSLHRLHNQAIENKVERVIQHAEILKSPQKTVIKHVGEKAIRPNKVSLPSELPHDVPEYILPMRPNKKVQPDREVVPEEINGSEYKKKAALLKPEIRESAKTMLPKSYNLLHEKFLYGDKLLSMLAQQNKRTTFEVLAENVRNSLKREFTKRDFSRIVYLYKEAFHYNLKERWMAFGGIQKGKWDIVIQANVEDDLKGWLINDDAMSKSKDFAPLSVPTMLCSPTKTFKSPRKQPCNPLPREVEIDTKVRVEGWRLSCRAQIFRHKLAELVYKAHDAFLKAIGVEIGKTICRFHPNFDLETCPEVPEAQLPEPPQNTIASKTMADYMKEVSEENVKLESVKKVLAELKSPEKSTKAGVPLSPKKFVQAGNGGVNALLARIRAKEAAKKAAASLIDPVKEERISKIDRLLLGVLRTVTSFFALKKTYSLHLPAVVDKMMQTVKFLSYDESVSLLQLLSEISPKNLELAEVAGQKYVRILKNDYEQIAANLRHEKSQLTL